MRRPRIAAQVCSGRTRRAPILFPLNFTGRTAVFEGEPGELERLCSRGPEAIAAPLDAAVALANACARGSLKLPSLSFALVVLTDVDNAPLDEHYRDLFWRAFRVPVFEQLQEWDGTVVARECEVHDGLHLVSGADARVEHDRLWIGGRRTGLSASVIADHCDCGTETSRLKNLSAIRALHTAANNTPALGLAPQPSLQAGSEVSKRAA